MVGEQVDTAMSERIKDEESGGGQEQVQVEGKPNMPVSMPSYQIERIPTAAGSSVVDDERWEVKFEPGESINPKVGQPYFSHARDRSSERRRRADAG